MFPQFSVNWANLILLHICGKSWVPENAISSVAKILQQIPHIVKFATDMASVTETGYAGIIRLPFLRFLSIRETVPRNNSECPGLLNFIEAPSLIDLNLGGQIFNEFSIGFISAFAYPAKPYPRLRRKQCYRSHGITLFMPCITCSGYQYI